MPSTIGWLDASREEQRRMREIIKLFEEKDSREELGLGQFRDALGDGLFPGTSTLHTRARYLLFVPWIFTRASARRGDLHTAETEERQLINVLRKLEPRPAGIIGGDVGAGVKTLPSSIYWSALRTYGILSGTVSGRDEAVTLHGTALPSDLAEIKPGTYTAWRSGIPQPPDGFPYSLPSAFDLTAPEASWLSERITDADPNSLMAHLLSRLVDSPVTADSTAPWEDPATASGVDNEPAARLLDHARLFSDVMHGAQLLYNLEIAKSYEHHSFTRIDAPVDRYTDRFNAWAATAAHRSDIAAWNLDEFFGLITTIRGSRVGRHSQGFVNMWHRLVVDNSPTLLSELPAARDLVTHRERSLKGPMARIGSPSRLKHWGGSSGAGRYTYRWSYVKTILNDIRDGLTRSPESATASDGGQEVQEPANA